MICGIKKGFSLFLVFILLINLNINVKAINAENNKAIKQDLLCLMLAYPRYITGIEVKSNGLIYIKMTSGKKFIYDDKKAKTIEEKFINSDLQDTMEQLYPLNFPKGLMAKNFDPGRCRNYELLREIYGFSKCEVEAKLKNVNVGSGYLQFNISNDAAKELSCAMKEISNMSQGNHNIRKNVYPTSGTYNYRYISGTNRLSPHSFGIAIDLASNKSDYWKWASVKDGEKRLLSYPKEIVNIFENHNFIWGGKWNHFDILHFEYRPEIILKARYFSENFNNESVWYKGAPFEIREKIDYIDKIIK